MRINAPKAFKDTVSMVKEFYFPKYVNIAKSYSEDPVTDALLRLEQSEDIFESYAKHKGVFVTIDRADSILIKDAEVKKDLKKIMARSIIVRVSDGITGKESSSVVDATKDSFTYSGAKYISHKEADGSSNIIKSVFSHEDNFLRSVYRAVERLADLVKK